MVAPGQLARRLLGRHFLPIGNAYRRFFVDLDRLAAFLDEELPQGARVIDIGGGDGALMDRLLTRRRDLKVTICDLAPRIGAFLSEQNRAKVEQYPATAFTDVPGQFDVVTITDVVHHVPVDQRGAFFQSLAESCARWGCNKIIVKDLEPGGVRAALSLFADRYITGDKQVVLFSRADFAGVARQYFPEARISSAVPDWPNYCEVLSWERTSQ
jgi:SAM-dependent methyltransferase